MAVETTRWGILYCPKSSKTTKHKRWEKIKQLLDERHVAYDMVQSENSDSVARLITMLINNGYKTIVVVGGDSALNDAVNCLMQEEKRVRDEIVLGVIPNGVMNDFARFWNYDEGNDEQTIEWLMKRHVRKVDLGCIRYTSKEGEHCHRYFLNCVNIGMTADIMNLRRQTRRLLRARWQRRWSQSIPLFKNIPHFKSITIFKDSRTPRDEVLPRNSIRPHQSVGLRRTVVGDRM